MMCAGTWGHGAVSHPMPAAAKAVCDIIAISAPPEAANTHAHILAVFEPVCNVKTTPLPKTRFRTLEPPVSRTIPRRMGVPRLPVLPGRINETGTRRPRDCNVTHSVRGATRAAGARIRQTSCLSCSWLMGPYVIGHIGPELMC